MNTKTKTWADKNKPKNFQRLVNSWLDKMNKWLDRYNTLIDAHLDKIFCFSLGFGLGIFCAILKIGFYWWF